jgi:hypothetical protein
MYAIWRWTGSMHLPAPATSLDAMVQASGQRPEGRVAH